MSSILIKNVDIFNPEPEGKKDILIINDRIAALASDIIIPQWLSETKIIEKTI